MHCSDFKKLSFSIIKPTRESFLDYCSYFLIVIALTGVARVWIGGSKMRISCPIIVENGDNDFAIEVHSSLSLPYEKVRLKEENSQLSSGEGETNQLLSLDDKDLKNLNVSKNTEPIHECAKYYQTTFAYILLIESTLLFFSGLVWDKVPKVTHTLKRFAEIVKECQESDWVKKALNVITDKGQVSDVSQSLYSVISNENASYDIKSLLDTLFHPNRDYQAKAKARHLYEKVQTFCESHSARTNIWSTYIIKSLLQFIIWIIIFNINLVLFVVLEFYYICPEDSAIPCDHDTFLRIIWFMGQTIILIYGVFNCKTLRWINEKSIVRRRSTCNIFSCFRTHRTLYTSDDTPLLTCRAFRFSDNPPVFNDVALLLHLFEESRPKILPYFVVFMFPEWKEKLTSFANPVQMSEMPIRSSMQMLSGRPPPIIEITDIPLLPDIEEKFLSSSTTETVKKKEKTTNVKFYIESAQEKFKDSRVRSNERDHTIPPQRKSPKIKSNYQSATLPLPKFLPHTQHNHNNRTHRLMKNQRHHHSAVMYSKQMDLKKVSQTPKIENIVLPIIPVSTESDSGCYTTRSEDNDELTALVHKTSSSDSVKSIEHNSQIDNMESNQSSDASETPLLN